MYIKVVCINQDAVKQIESSFGFKTSTQTLSDGREKRQIVVLATIAITSLITYFSTKNTFSPQLFVVELECLSLHIFVA